MANNLPFYMISVGDYITDKRKNTDKPWKMTRMEPILSPITNLVQKSIFRTGLGKKG